MFWGPLDFTTSNNQLSENLRQKEEKDDDIFVVLLKRMKSSYEHLFRFLFHQTSILKYEKRCLYLHFTAKSKYCFFSLVSHVCRVGRQVDTWLLVHDIISKIWEIQHSYSSAISTSVKIKHKLGCGNNRVSQRMLQKTKILKSWRFVCNNMHIEKWRIKILQ